jgi:primosomal protein N''
MTTNEHPITRLTIKMERAARDVERLDAWTRDPKNADSCDWDYEYRELRKAQARVNRCRVAILRLDRALYAQDFDYDAAIARVRGLRAWCNRPAWRH